MSDNPHSRPPLPEGDFMRLFVSHEGALRAYARTLLPDLDLVDEALQEASVTMWEKLDQLSGEDGFLPWAKVIVRFKCLSMISQIRRDRRLLSDAALTLLAREAEAVEAEDHEAARAAMRICLKEFSSTHQELLLAPYAGPGDVLKLAEKIQKSPNALYKMLGRLRSKLARCVHGRLRVEAT